MENQLLTPLAAFNQAQKENDTSYRNYARSAGLSDAAFWILYSVAEREALPYTQRELCTSWFFPVQTVNSALKTLCRREILALEAMPDNRKNKRITLTPAGKELVLEVIAPLMEAEQRALKRMGAEEYRRFLAMTRSHVALLKEEIDKITPVGKENS